MSDAAIAYDHINKRLVADLGEHRFSIPVTVTGTKHAAISAAEADQRTGGAIPVEELVRALKKYRNRAGKSFIVALEP